IVKLLIEKGAKVSDIIIDFILEEEVIPEATYQMLCYFETLKEENWLLGEKRAITIAEKVRVVGNNLENLNDLLSTIPDNDQWASERNKIQQRIIIQQLLENNNTAISIDEVNTDDSEDETEDDNKEDTGLSGLSCDYRLTLFNT